MTTWQEIESHWPDFRPKVQAKWNKLTMADLDKIHGKRDILITSLKDRYQMKKEEAVRQIDEFLKVQKPVTTK